MFNTVKTKLRDMGTIKQLCELAEAHALEDRLERPGAEHFLLAALDLKDCTAQLAFQEVGADPEGLKLAIDDQYAAALHSIGIAVEASVHSEDAGPRLSEPGAYQAARSGQEVMQTLAESRQQHGPLLGAHVVAIVAAIPHGVAARALRSMGVDAAALQDAADEIANSFTSA